MLAFEKLAIGYLAALCLAAPLARASRARTAKVVLLCAAAILAIAVIERSSSALIRLLVPHAYLLGGYYLPALLATPGSTRFEAWLVASNTRWQFREPTHRGVVRIIELAYLCCYPIVPIALFAVWTLGDALDIERFWSAVLGSAFACYFSLPWLVSRPPRLLRPGQDEPLAIRRLNTLVLGRLSHQLNTFPSGHVAVSTAAAVAVLFASWPAGIPFLLLAGAIALGAVAGGYHYVVDVLLGAIVGVAWGVLTHLA